MPASQDILVALPVISYKDAADPVTAMHSGIDKTAGRILVEILFKEQEFLLIKLLFQIAVLDTEQLVLPLREFLLQPSHRVWQTEGGRSPGHYPL